MNSKSFMGWIVALSLLVTIFSGCAAPARVKTEPPALPDRFLSAKWGASVEEVKSATKMDENPWFQDGTGAHPFALYASGKYLGYPAIFTYFFTSKSKKLYRVDLTFSDLAVYEKARNDLTERFKRPSFSQKDVDHWSWENKSLVILQKDLTHVQISYSSGPFLIQNHEEGDGVRGK